MFKAGDCILTVKPIAHSVHSHLLKNICDGCCTRQPNLLQCTQCQNTYYCNRQCQKAAWAWHKMECSAMKRCGKAPPATVRLLLKIIMLWKKFGDDMRDSVGYRSFGDLESHVVQFRQKQLFVSQFTAALKSFKDFLGSQSSHLPSDEVIFLLYCKVQINAYQICDSEFNPIGLGLFLSGAAFNHSCLPNAVNIFHGNQLYVVAMTSIPSLEDVRITYVEHIRSREHRHSQLMEQYCFQCDCDACSNQEWETLLSGISCPAEDCTGRLSSHFPSCPKCGKSPNPVWMEQQLRQRHKLSEKLDALQNDLLIKGADIDTQRELEDLLKDKTLTHHLSIPNSLSYRALDLLFEVLLERAQWKEAFNLGKVGSRLYDVYQKLFSFADRQHPLQGLFLLKMTKLADLEEEDKEAKQLWLESKSIMDLYLPFWPKSSKEQIDFLHDQLILPD